MNTMLFFKPYPLQNCGLAVLRVSCISELHYNYIDYAYIYFREGALLLQIH